MSYWSEKYWSENYWDDNYWSAEATPEESEEDPPIVSEKTIQLIIEPIFLKIIERVK